MTKDELENLLQFLPQNSQFVLSILPNDLEFLVKNLHNKGWEAMIRSGPWGEEIVVSGRNYFLNKESDVTENKQNQG